MKEIKAIIQPSGIQKIHDVFHHLKRFPGMGAARLEWFGEHAEERRTIKEELTDFSKRGFIVIVAPDERVDEIIRIIVDCTYTGQPGDGVIWVTPVEKEIRIDEAGNKDKERGTRT